MFPLKKRICLLFMTFARHSFVLVDTLFSRKVKKLVKFKNFKIILPQVYYKKGQMYLKFFPRDLIASFM